MKNPDKEKRLEGLFEEIKQGFSLMREGSDSLYIKHPTSKEIDVSSKTYDTYFEKAIKLGVQPEKELLEFLNEQEAWTTAEEDQMIVREQQLKNLNKTVNKIRIERDRKPIEEERDTVKAQVTLDKLKRSSLVRKTAESYAQKHSNEIFIYSCLYKDAELKNPYWSLDDFEQLSHLELNEFLAKYEKHVKRFEHDELLQLSITSCFTSLFNLFGNDVTEFFKNHPMDMSYYQVHLLNYGKMFKNIFKNREIPDHIKDDAKAILAHLEDMENIKNNKDTVKNKSQKSDGFSYAGATKKDLDNLGVKKGRNQKDIHQIAKEKGGKLNMEDFLALHKK